MTRLRALTAALLVGGCLMTGARAATAADEVILRTGELLSADLQEPDLAFVTPNSTFRVTRANTWRILLGQGAEDEVELRDGSRLSGVAERARYAVRLASGETRSFARDEIAVIALAGPSTPLGARRGDVLLLANGDHVYGDLLESAVDLVLETGTQRFAREHIRRIALGTVVDDSVYLVNGDRLSGIVTQATYRIRTGDGQVLTFWRGEVDEVLLRGPAPQAAAAPAAAGVAAPTPPRVPPAAPAPAPPAPGVPVPAPPAPAPAPGPALPQGAPPVAAVPPAALPAPVREVLRDIHFEFDRYDLTDEAKATLEVLAAAMKPLPEVSLLIEGHADERGTTDYNLALGARRAETAKAYLVSLGIDPARIGVVSYGKERPLDPGRDEVAWALNRRAHFVVRTQ